MLPYCDLHTHSTCSDGKLTLQQLTDQARRCGIGVLAPTDHNAISDLTALRRDNPDMILIDGTEASCRYVDLTGKVQQELIAAGVLPKDYDFESHKRLVPMQPGDVVATYADVSELVRDTGFRPETSIRTGLRNFARWYREFYGNQEENT